MLYKRDLYKSDTKQGTLVHQMMMHVRNHKKNHTIKSRPHGFKQQISKQTQFSRHKERREIFDVQDALYPGQCIGECSRDSKSIGSGTYAKVHKGAFVNFSLSKKERSDVAVKVFDDGNEYKAELCTIRKMLHKIPSHYRGFLCLPMGHSHLQKSLVLPLCCGHLRNKNVLTVMNQAFERGILGVCNTLWSNISCALEYLHAYNICHNDVHPGNILLNQKGTEFVLSDFGMTTLHDDAVHDAVYDADEIIQMLMSGKFPRLPGIVGYHTLGMIRRLVEMLCVAYKAKSLHGEYRTSEIHANALYAVWYHATNHPPRREWKPQEHDYHRHGEDVYVHDRHAKTALELLKQLLGECPRMPDSFKMQMNSDYEGLVGSVLDVLGKTGHRLVWPDENNPGLVEFYNLRAHEFIQLADFGFAKRNWFYALHKLDRVSFEPIMLRMRVYSAELASAIDAWKQLDGDEKNSD